MGVGVPWEPVWWALFCGPPASITCIGAEFGGMGLTALKGESHCCQPDRANLLVERLGLPNGTDRPRVSRHRGQWRSLP